MDLLAELPCKKISVRNMSLTWRPFFAAKDFISRKKADKEQEINPRRLVAKLVAISTYSLKRPLFCGIYLVLSFQVFSLQWLLAKLAKCITLPLNASRHKLVQQLHLLLLLLLLCNHHHTNAIWPQ